MSSTSRTVGCFVAFAALAALGPIAACSSDGTDPTPLSSSGTTGNPNPTGTGTGTGTVPTSTTTTPPPPTDPPPGAAPRAVKTAKATAIPACTIFVDGANAGTANGTSANPFKTIGAGVTAAAAGGIICVAQGTYAEAIAPGTKYFTLAGGFQTGKDFKVRDSSVYVTKAQGNGSNRFLNIGDPGPTAGQLTAVDGFEITGYSQGIVRDIYYSQKLDITNNYIHDNVCTSNTTSGGGFSLNNVTGTIKGNVIAKNKCGRGGGGSVYDGTASNAVTIEGNLVDSNEGLEPSISHGGGLYLFAKTLTVTANEVTANTVTAWGGGIYVGADVGAGINTVSTMSWNVYRGNKAGVSGGGFFCDDSATCNSDHDLFDKNCGGNIYLDSGPNTAPTIARFDHATIVGGLAVGCGGPGQAVQIDKDSTAADSYTFTNTIFWGNASGKDFIADCGSGCGALTINVKYSIVQTTYVNNGATVTFGAGNVTPTDPLFVGAATGDYHLQSKIGHWAGNVYARDNADSPALKVGDPAATPTANPARAGDRTELGTYGNSVEASLVK